FYDISQSIEFQNRGYKVVIPKQVEPWCIHDCGLVKISNGYSDYRIKTLKNYSLVDKNNEDLFDFDKDYAKNIMYDN
ncbi:glycosyltransferase, partial [Escherichia sp. TWPC-MK]